MIVERLPIPDLVVITPRCFADARGYFVETWHRQKYVEADVACDWVQDNQSLSRHAGTVRGLHLQVAPYPQAKLVRVCQGRIFDVAVDLRAHSPSYARWVGRELSAVANDQLFIPAGFAHGFLTLEPNCVVAYKVSAPYAPECERSIIWNDPTIGIDWPWSEAPLLSEKDAAAPALSAIQDQLIEQER